MLYNLASIYMELKCNSILLFKMCINSVMMSHNNMSILFLCALLCHIIILSIFSYYVNKPSYFKTLIYQHQKTDYTVKNIKQSLNVINLIKIISQLSFLRNKTSKKVLVKILYINHLNLKLTISYLKIIMYI